MKTLQEIVNTYYKISNQAFQEIEKLASLVELPKKTIIFEPHRYEDKFYFIAKGSARVYVIDENGNEISYVLFFEGDNLISFEGYLHQKPSYEFIELLEDSTLYQINTEELKALYNKNIEIANLGRVLADRFAYATEQRFIDRLSLSATARYLKLIEKNPEIIQRIPLKYIASYLGITQVSLSRIHSKI